MRYQALCYFYSEAPRNLFLEHMYRNHFKSINFSDLNYNRRSILFPNPPLSHHPFKL